MILWLLVMFNFSFGEKLSLGWQGAMSRCHLEFISIVILEGVYVDSG